MYDVSEHINVDGHVVFGSSIQLYIANLDGTCLDVGALMFTYKSSATPEKYSEL